MTRSLAILARKNKEANGHLGDAANFQSIDDGSILSYDMSVARIRRDRLAADQMGNAPITAASAHTPSNNTAKGNSLFASIARKVSARISFRDGSNEKSELAAAALAVNSHENESKLKTPGQHGQSEENSNDDDQPLAQHLDGRKEPRRRGEGLSPPSIIADDMTVATKFEDGQTAKPRRSHSVPTPKRRGRRSNSVTTSSRDQSAKDRRPSSGSKNSSGADSDSKPRSQQRSKHHRPEEPHSSRDSELEQVKLSASLSDLDRLKACLDDEDDEGSEKDTRKRTRRRLVVKVRNKRIGEDKLEHADGRDTITDAELIRDALKHVSSRKIDQLLQSKMAQNARSRRRGSNGVQSCAEPQKKSHDIRLDSNSPLASRNPLRVKMSKDGHSPKASPATTNILTVSMNCMDKPERIPSLSLHSNEIDAPTCLLQSSAHSPSVQDKVSNRSRGKPRDDKEKSKSPGRSHKRESVRRPRHDGRSPASSPVKSDTSRSPSSARESRTGTSPKVGRDHVQPKSSFNPEDIDSLLLEADGRCSSKRSDHNSKKKNLMQTKQSDMGPSQSRNALTLGLDKDRGLVKEMKKEIEESSQRIRARWKRDNADDVELLHTPGNRAVRSLRLDKLLPQPNRGSSDADSVAESTTTGAPRLLRRKRASARSPANQKSVLGATGLSHRRVSARKAQDPAKESNRMRTPSSSGANATHSPQFRDRDRQIASHDSSQASESDVSEVDVQSGDYGISQKVSYDMEDYSDNDIIILKPSGSRSKPVVAAQLHLPGLSSSNVCGDEISVQYEDVTAYNSDNNGF